MTYKELQALLLKRMDELDRWTVTTPRPRKKLFSGNMAWSAKSPKRWHGPASPASMPPVFALLARRKAKLAKS